MLARDHLRQCEDAIPGFLDCAERLSESRAAIRLAEQLYDRAQRAAGRGDRDRARLLFEECLAVTCPFRDAEERLGAGAAFGRDPNGAGPTATKRRAAWWRVVIWRVR